MGVEDGDIAKLNRASGDRKIACHESVAGDVGIAADTNPSTHGEGTGGGRPRLLGIKNGDVTELDGASGHGKVTSHESVAGDIRIAPDTDPSTYGESAGRSRPRLLRVENSHITKLDGASGHGQVSSHEGVASDIRVAANADTSTHRKGTRGGRPRLLGVEDGDITKLNRASGDGQVASHESVTCDIDIAADADPSTHCKSTRRGRPRLLRVENSHITKLDGASCHGKIACHESVAGDVGIAADTNPSTHGEGTGGGRPRLLGVENRDVAKLDGASGHGQVSSHEGITRNISVAADTDASTHRKGTCRGRSRLLRVENRDVAKLDGASGHGQVASHEGVTRNIRVAANADPSTHCKGTRGRRSRLLGIEDGDGTKLRCASGDGQVAS